MTQNVRAPTGESRKVVDRYLHQLLDLVSINPETNGAQITHNGPARNLLRVIAGNLEFPALPLRSDHESFVLMGCGLLKSRADATVEDLVSAIDVEIRRVLPKRTKSTTVLLPLNASLPAGVFSTVELLGITFERVSWDDVSGIVRLKEFTDTYTQKLGLGQPFPLATRFTPFLARFSNEEPVASGFRAMRAFQLLRAPLNWQLQYGRLTRRLGTFYPRPRAPIAAPPVYGIFDTSGSFETFVFNTPRPDEFRSNEIDAARADAATGILADLSKEPERNETRYLVTDAFLRYGEALDAVEARLAFLSFWQMLETLAIQDGEGINMRTVVNRISVLFSKKELLRDLLMTCYETRNGLVHRGIFVDDFADEEIGHLKSIAEGALASILDLRADFPTRASLESFYELATVPNSILDQREAAIRATRKRRTP